VAAPTLPEAVFAIVWLVIEGACTFDQHPSDDMIRLITHLKALNIFSVAYVSKCDSTPWRHANTDK
jgi:hypothetical protein